MIIFTGQHAELDPADYRLERYAAVRLRCPGQHDPHAHVASVTREVLPVLSSSTPDLVIVQGDTSSALGGALAAGVAAIPLAHVEAGLRSHDPCRPWPEEEFRVAIDRESDLLFAPTELSAANLRREGVRGQIHVTGNSGIDALMWLGAKPATQAGAEPRLLVTCHRRENWGAGIDGVAAALRTIANEGLASVEVVLHPNPALAQRVRSLLSGQARISLESPSGHSEIVTAMLRSDLVLSDSGGMQEEASALGVPLLVLRDKTERPEAVASGNVELVGTRADRIVKAVRRRLKGRSNVGVADVFGDGLASQRIARIVDEWLAQRGAPSKRSGAVRRTA